MEHSYKKLTDQDTTDAAEMHDLMFINRDGKLMQVTLDQIIAAGGTRQDLNLHKVSGDHDKRYYTKTEMDTKLNALQPEITCDDTPTNGSANPITSGGVYTALGNRSKLIFDEQATQNSNNLVTSGVMYNHLVNKQSKLTFDNTPTSNSTKPVTSGGVYTAINNVKVSARTVYFTVGAGASSKYVGMNGFVFGNLIVINYIVTINSNAMSGSPLFTINNIDNKSVKFSGDAYSCAVVGYNAGVCYVQGVNNTSNVKIYTSTNSNSNLKSGVNLYGCLIGRVIVS